MNTHNDCTMSLLTGSPSPWHT